MDTDATDIDRAVQNETTNEQTDTRLAVASDAAADLLAEADGQDGSTAAAANALDTAREHHQHAQQKVAQAKRTEATAATTLRILRGVVDERSRIGSAAANLATKTDEEESAADGGET